MLVKADTVEAGEAEWFMNTAKNLINHADKTKISGPHCESLSFHCTT